MIHIFSQGEPAGEFPLWKWRDGDRHLLRLSDIRMFQNSRRQMVAYASYEPLFILNRHPGQLVVQWIPSNTLVIISRRRPYLTFEVLS